MKFQYQEYNDDLGVDIYEFKYRMDDPQIGRFWQSDPLSEKYVYNSTYAFSENKVIAHIELEGKESKSVNNKSGTEPWWNATNYWGANLVRGAIARNDYNKEAAPLWGKTDDASKTARADLKEKYRKVTPEPWNSMTEENRPMAGERAKVKDPTFLGNAGKTNAAVDVAAEAGGVIGKGLLLVGIANSIDNIANATDPVKQTSNELFTWGGAIAGGSAGSTWGAGVAGWPGALVFGFLGSIAGGIMGDHASNALNNNSSAVEGIKEDLIKAMPKSKREDMREVLNRFGD